MSTLELEHLKHTSSSSNNLSVHSDGTVVSNNKLGIGTVPNSTFGSLLYAQGTPAANKPIISGYSQGNSNNAGLALFNDTGNRGIWTGPGSSMRFTRSYEGNSTVDMNIDSSGRVTMPNQPACFAFKSGSGNGTSDSGAGALNATGTNTGNHFDTSTGRFTCPVAGVYMVCWTMMNHQNNTGTPTCVLRVNGVGYKYFHVENSHPQGQSDQLVYTANANDYFDISLSNYHWNGGSQNKYPSMSVFLIG